MTVDHDVVHYPEDDQQPAAVVTHYQAEQVTVLHGDCIDAMRAMPAESVHAVVTDPPYGIEFMGKTWDSPDSMAPAVATHAGGRFQHWCELWAREALRVLKPGGHLLAFGGTRTWHRLAAGIEDAGFEVRDSMAWLYGSGFPKSHDVSKAVDKLDAAAERRTRALQFTAWMRTTGLTAPRIDELTGTRMGGHFLTDLQQPAVATADLFDVLRPHLPEVPAEVEALVAERTVESENYAARAVTGMHEKPAAAQVWRGNLLGERIAPATERRDVAHTDEARAWQGWGTALKPAFEPIVVARKPFPGTVAANVVKHGTGALNIDASRTGEGGDDGKGRWPANVVLDEVAAAELDRQAPDTGGAGRASGPSLREPTEAGAAYGARNGLTGDPAFYGDRGGASRFFYVAKAPSSERPEAEGTVHATVKPLDLMQRLVRLVTPPGGTVLEPFAGSGTTLEAALREGFHVIGIEREAEYLPLIMQRLDKPHAQSLFDDLGDA